VATPIAPPADARVGRTIDEIDTPALLLDLDLFEANSRRLMSTLEAGGKSWRPHSKGHKAPWIAHRQLEFGAIGVTCGKVGEAEVMVEHGIPSVLVANELAARVKVERAARLLDRAEVIVCADAPFHVQLASAVGQAAGVDIPMLVDLDIGMERTGARPGRDGLELARLIDSSPGVRFAGIMGYEGHTLTLWPPEERMRATKESIDGLVETRRLIESDGIRVSIVSGGGSGDHEEAASLEGLTELQAGGACFMDRFYGEECHLEERGFEYALTILTTVTSRPHPERVITDAGFKTLSTRDEMPPLVVGRPDLELGYLSAEHGRWSRRPDSPEVAIGDRLQLRPDYHDTTTFRHNEFIGVRGGRVETIIPLLGRGRLT
jgi:D-serine deaminase-like pyridoxal phosphate-dependent protein